MADEQSIVSQPTIIGMLITAIAALASVVIYLWRDGKRQQRRMDGERKLMLQERSAWDVEREKLRADFEARCRSAVEDYAKQLRALDVEHVEALKREHADNRENEAVIRREFAELMEQISVEAGKHADAIRSVLQKFLDRFVGPRAR